MIEPNLITSLCRKYGFKDVEGRKSGWCSIICQPIGCRVNNSVNVLERFSCGEISDFLQYAQWMIRELISRPVVVLRQHPQKIEGRSQMI